MRANDIVICTLPR